MTQPNLVLPSDLDQRVAQRRILDALRPLAIGGCLPSPAVVQSRDVGSGWTNQAQGHDVDWLASALLEACELAAHVRLIDLITGNTLVVTGRVRRRENQP